MTDYPIEADSPILPLHERERGMAKRGKKKRPPTKQSQGGITLRTGRAPAHGGLAHNRVHVFVDDQNLFYGIRNIHQDHGYRIDFGRMLLEIAKDTNGNTRFIESAYIAGVIPDDDSFWRVAENQGFTVRRGYLGAGNRSKQDDAYLISDMVETVCCQPGPATLILVAGDADYVPPLMKALDRQWRTEVAFIERGISIALEGYVHEFRTLSSSAIQLIR